MTATEAQAALPLEAPVAPVGHTGAGIVYMRQPLDRDPILARLHLQAEVG